MEKSLAYVLTQSLDIPATKLRDIQSHNPEYVDLLLSIQKWGVLEPVLVRESKTPGRLTLIDGVQRWSCADKIGLEKIPVHNISVDSSEEALILSMVCNMQTVKTPPYQYAKAMRRVIRKNPELTLEKLSSLLGKPVVWIKERLGLAKLSEDIGGQVDTGDIGLKAAYGLSMLDEADQVSTVPQVTSMSADDFYTACVGIARDKLSVKKVPDQEKRAPEVRVNPALRNLGAVEREIERSDAFQMLVQSGVPITSKHDAFKLALQWVIQIDPISLRERKSKAVKSMDKIQAERDRVKRSRKPENRGPKK